MRASSATTPNAKPSPQPSRRGKHSGTPPLPLLCLPTLTHSTTASYIGLNTLLPFRLRTRAMIDLAQMNPNTRPMKIKNRCIMGGKGRGIMRAFRVSRVCVSLRGIPGPLLMKGVGGVVSVSTQCEGGEYSGGEEGDLVV